MVTFEKVGLVELVPTVSPKGKEQKQFCKVIYLHSLLLMLENGIRIMYLDTVGQDRYKVRQLKDSSLLVGCDYI